MNAAHDGRWLSEVDLANGARLYERYAGKRVLVEVDGQKPAVMPNFTKGANGCGTRMVFHSVLRELSDGTLVGAGQACAGKDDQLTMASRTAVMRSMPTKGPLAVEIWPKAT